MEHPASSLLDERAAGPAGSDLVNLCCLSSEDGGRGRVLARPRVRRGRPTREAGHGGAHLAVSCCWEAVDPHARLEALPHPGPGRTHGSFVLYVLRGYSRELSNGFRETRQGSSEDGDGLGGLEFQTPCCRWTNGLVLSFAR